MRDSTADRITVSPVSRLGAAGLARGALAAGTPAVPAPRNTCTARGGRTAPTQMFIPIPA